MADAANEPEKQSVTVTETYVKERADCSACGHSWVARALETKEAVTSLECPKCHKPCGEMRADVDIPNWVTRYAARCCEALGLAAWKIKYLWVFKASMEPETPDKRVIGLATCDPRILEAVIEFDDGLLPDEQGKSTIMHEHFHVATSLLIHVIYNIIDELPERRRENTKALLEIPHEMTVQQISRALSLAIKE